MAVHTSSMKAAHRSAAISFSRYFRMKEENAVADRLSPWASRWYANVLLSKLKARS